MWMWKIVEMTYGFQTEFAVDPFRMDPGKDEALLVASRATRAIVGGTCGCVWKIIELSGWAATQLMNEAGKVRLVII